MRLRGLAGVKKVNGRVLTHADMNAHNTFEQPETVEPQAFNGVTDVSEGGLSATLPPMSVVVLTLARITSYNVCYTKLLRCRYLLEKSVSADKSKTQFKYLLLFGDGSYDNRSTDASNTNKIITYQSRNNFV